MDIQWTFWVTLFIACGSVQISGEFLEDHNHKTAAANHQYNDLWCYQCDTMDDGDKCSNLSAGNHSKLAKKCPENHTECMVKRYSYTTSTENSTSVLRMWSLERNCTHKCFPGCIVIGERTKLYACTACCSKSLCNTGKGSSGKLLPHILVIFTAILGLKII